MVLALVAVALAGGNCGLDLYAATHSGPADGTLLSAAAGTHEHHDGRSHTHSDKGHTAQAALFDIAIPDSGDNAAGSDHPGHNCPFAHAHCCATLALAASSCDVVFEDRSQSLIFDHAAALAYGQLPYTPLRPPRAIA